MMKLKKTKQTHKIKMAPKQQQNKGVVQVFPQEMRSLRQKKKKFNLPQMAL